MLILSRTAIASGVAAHAPNTLPSAGGLSNQLNQDPPTSHPLTNEAFVSPFQFSNTKATSKPAKKTQSSERLLITRVIFKQDASNQSWENVPLYKLEKELEPLIGKALNIDEIGHLAEVASQLLQRQGMILARVVLPPQKVVNGTLTLLVLPGRYDTSSIRGHGALQESFVRSFAENAFPIGKIILKDDLDRAALLLSEIPGTEPSVKLQKGEKPGDIQPVIDIRTPERGRAYIGMDNYGDQLTGREQLLTGGRINNIAGRGDLLKFDMKYSKFGDGVVNGTLDYSLLAGNLRMGASYSRLDYSLAYWNQQVSGYSQDFGIYTTWPLMRKLQTRVDLRLDAGQKYATDYYPSFDFFDDGKASRRRINTLRLSGYGSSATTKGGVSMFSLSATLGETNYLTEMAQWLSFSDISEKEGQFSKLNFSIGHLQDVTNNWFIYFNLNGQRAFNDLDSAEKFIMGGPTAVRAYEVSEGSVDSGANATFEVRKKWVLPSSALFGGAPNVTLGSFYDHAVGEYFQRSSHLMSENRVNMSGAGIFLSGDIRNNTSVTLTAARRTGDSLSMDSDKNKFWLTFNKQF